LEFNGPRAQRGSKVFGNEEIIGIIKESPPARDFFPAFAAGPV
jgi:hypothetical protein